MVVWKILELERNSSDGLVLTAHWEASIFQDGYHARVYGSISLPHKESEDPSFIPYEELTQETVLNWVFREIGEEQVALYEQNLAGQIEALINPPTQHGLPWDSNTTQVEVSEEEQEEEEQQQEEGEE